jgi:hypothetical protein
MKKQPTTEEPLLPLSQALRLLKDDKKTSWMPSTRLRKAVINGEVPCRRSSEAKKARYYVRLSDLKAVPV